MSMELILLIKYLLETKSKGGFEEGFQIATTINIKKLDTIEKGR